ncbi:extra-large guanine nucleotide-binding protein 3-like [Lycium ferocissimum]|uniref:extra-large guanine nucleotide-binding protein 3-like n=1 Tax=Lycium ferocissimum TaxID=112874 RepID=UPI002815943C|nr:extra-large guanine nucleotide-binding protein 3-like [Lycium ferocissimum]
MSINWLSNKKKKKKEYEPSKQHILYAVGVTQGNVLAFMVFSLDDRSSMFETLGDNLEAPAPPFTRYQLIRVNANGINEGYKWVEMFALSDYLIRCGLFQRTTVVVHIKEVRHPCFKETPFVLILNKYDLFEKVARVPLESCESFTDFSPVQTHYSNLSLANQAYYYVPMIHFTVQLVQLMLALLHLSGRSKIM